ncbi:peptidase M4 [Actinomadura sp. GC306]|uniref:PepSY domain-containing protein n=1 Tax=Actinomadura sp. GC306 TaxID=2530367 RepID=UPI001043278B|nr:PepSY domain-containing protein [Actinomadura sp. GC306]TDC67170.1 peptidase M4 [Actinomadura sp. GC306]
MSIFTGRKLLATVVTAGVLAGGGATIAAAANSGGDQGAGPPPAGPAIAATPSQQPTDDGAATRPAGEPVTAVKAAAAALKAVPGKVAEIDLDDGVWEVEVLAKNGKWRDVDVSADSGKVLSNRVDDDDDDDRDEAAALRKAKVSASDAAKAALKAAPGTVTSVEFDEDDGKAVWEIEITGQDGNERELEVNAATAKVVFDDDDDDDDDDDRDDD